MKMMMMMILIILIHIDRDLGNDRTELFFPGIVDDGDEEEEVMIIVFMGQH